jgi:glycosyltransferase involved in cell wall biosynthesis
MADRPPAPRRILFVQYRDNVSGAPRVLADAVRWAQGAGIEVEILTSPTEGFLHRIDGVSPRHLRSRFGQPGARPGWLQFAWMQLEVSIEILKARWRGCDGVWFNTIFHPLPLLVAALAIPLRVVHLHEVPRPRWIGTVLGLPVRLAATHALFVSRFAMREGSFAGGAKAHLVPNGVPSLPDPASIPDRFRQKRVVLAASLAPFKGAAAFVALARRCPDIAFRLALDATESQAREFLGPQIPPANLELLCGHHDRESLFGDASVVVNATLPRLREETFGLTVAEAMGWGIPSIVPPAGGIVELVEDGVNGFLRDPEDTAAMESALVELLSDEVRYTAFAEAARRRSEEFTLDGFRSRLDELFLR